jgi:hypothetical protein
MELRRVLLVVLAAPGAALGVLAAGCSPDPGIAPPRPCGAVDASCPAQPPSFAHDVDPIIVTYCNACHGEGGIEQALYDYTSYQGIFRARSSMASFVSDCRMPPADAGLFPSDEERQTVLQWISCGAPNN